MKRIKNINEFTIKFTNYKAIIFLLLWPTPFFIFAFSLIWVFLKKEFSLIVQIIIVLLSIGINITYYFYIKRNFKLSKGKNKLVQDIKRKR